MKIFIKGQKYNIEVRDFIDKGDTAGEIDKIGKQILIAKDSLDINHTILHELTHAFFYECGLYEECSKEGLVNRIAHHIPEIVKVYEKIKVSELYQELKN